MFGRYSTFAIESLTQNINIKITTMYKLKETILKTRTMLMLLAVIFLAFSCKKEDVSLPDNSSYEWKTNNQQMPPSRSENHSNNGSIEDVAIVLGDTISDPYKLENMQKAYNNINNGNAPISSVKANYRYVRVLPASQDELKLIESDTTLLLFDYPLHYEIAVAGIYYHDPTVADSTLTWLYSVVPLNYQFPAGINEELIYYVYIPPTESKGDFYDRLEEEAYRVVGYEDQGDGSKATNSTWIPSATIRVWDDLLQRNIPLRGALVTARYGTKVRSGITNSSGFCYVNGEFRYKVNYAIKWESAYWVIRDGMFWAAWYNGPKQKSAWDLTISGGKSLRYATIHRAAYKHYYGNNFGLYRPVSQFGKTKICYINTYSDNMGIYWGSWPDMGLLPDIKIWGKKDANTYFPTSLIFGTTCHELAHHSHWLYISAIQYAQVNILVYESWANAVEWVFTNDEYHQLGYTYNNTNAINYNHEMGGKQNWTGGSYSPIFVDLIDNFNQTNSCYFYCYNPNEKRYEYRYHPGGSSYSDDRVTGYSLSFIQNHILNHAYGLSSLYTYVKQNKPAGFNVTNSDIDALFAKYW